MDIFRKWKTNRKFKAAGEGHRLNDTPPARAEPATAAAATAAAARPARANETTSEENLTPTARAALQRSQAASGTAPRIDRFAQQLAAEARASEARQAAAAAQQTCAICQQAQPLASLREHVDACKAARDAAVAQARLARFDVRFQCPLCAEPVERTDPTQHIRACAALAAAQCDPHAAATTVLLAPAAERDACVATLLRYLDNMVGAPAEPKYRRIRMANKVFAAKVAPVLGAVELFYGIGFAQEMLPSEDSGAPEPFLVLPDAEFDVNFLAALRAGLADGSLALRPRIVRDARFIDPPAGAERAGAAAAREDDMPTRDELRAQLAAMAAQREQATQLQTKAMRERDAALRRTPADFAVVRFRLPGLNGVLQGTFDAAEPVAALFDFVRSSSLAGDDLRISIATVPERLALDEAASVTIAQLELTPAALLQVSCVGGAQSSGAFPLRPDLAHVACDASTSV